MSVQKIFAVVAVAGLIWSGAGHSTAQPTWKSLFNGKDLTGWTPKIKGHKLGENFGNTFRVVDGMIQVRYDNYEEFGEQFGHLFFKTPYSKYRLRMEYRFVGEQAKGGPGWAWRNSGIMIHGQSAESMGVDQSFPVSAEVQFLGGDKTGDRPTGNLCTPGTNVVMEDKLITPHVINSKSRTFRGDQWVKIEIVVDGNGVIEHYVNGEKVLTYSKVQYDPNDADAKRLIPKDGNLMISGGTISLQSESHPVDFRNIEIMPL